MLVIHLAPCPQAVEEHELRLVAVLDREVYHLRTGAGDSAELVVSHLREAQRAGHRHLAEHVDGVEPRFDFYDVEAVP